MTPTQRTLDELYRRYHRQIHAYLSRMTGDAQEAEDLTQEVFLKAYRQLPRPNDSDHQRSWLFQVATCVCFDHYRRRSRRVRAAPVPDGAQFPSPVDPYEQSQSAAAVVTSLRRLTARHRAALILKDVHGFKHADIARFMGISEGAAQLLLHRARNKFRHAYSEVLAGTSAACPFAARVASDLVGGTLTPERRNELLEHAETCPECRDRTAGRSLPVGALGFLLPPPPMPGPGAPLLSWEAATSAASPTLAPDPAVLSGVLSRVLALLAPKAAAVTLGAALAVGGPLAAEHVVPRVQPDRDGLTFALRSAAVGPAWTAAHVRAIIIHTVEPGAVEDFAGDGPHAHEGAGEPLAHSGAVRMGSTAEDRRAWREQEFPTRPGAPPDWPGLGPATSAGYADGSGLSHGKTHSDPAGTPRPEAGSGPFSGRDSDPGVPQGTGPGPTSAGPGADSGAGGDDPPTGRGAPSADAPVAAAAGGGSSTPAAPEAPAGGVPNAGPAGRAANDVGGPSIGAGEGGGLREAAGG